MIQSKLAPGLEQMDQLWAGAQMDQLKAGCLSYAQGHKYTCFQEEKCKGLSSAGSAPHLLHKDAF